MSYFDKLKQIVGLIKTSNEAEDTRISSAKLSVSSFLRDCFKSGIKGRYSIILSYNACHGHYRLCLDADKRELCIYNKTSTFEETYIDDKVKIRYNPKRDTIEILANDDVLYWYWMEKHIPELIQHIENRIIECTKNATGIDIS